MVAVPSQKRLPDGSNNVTRCVEFTLLVSVSVVSLGVFVPGRSEAQTFTTLHNFDGSDGTGSAATLTLCSNYLFGTSPTGGTFGGGTVFRINTDGTGFTNLYSFTGTNDGSAPQFGLVQSGTTLYGTTPSGGKLSGGTLFAIQMDGSGFTNLYNFPANNGGPSGLLLADGMLYGTMPSGGSAGGGTIFVVGIDGTGFTTLHNFTGTSGEGSDGWAPAGGLTIFSNVLYGTTTSGNGSVFAINSDGTGFSTLHFFAESTWGDGYRPATGVILSGDTLYGTATFGGLNGLGTVFAVKTNGTDFTVLWNFSQLIHEVMSARVQKETFARVQKETA